MIAYQVWVFEFLRTTITNVKNLPNNRQGSIHLFLFLIIAQECGNIIHGYKY
jgi:hypothetical protein